MPISLDADLDPALYPLAWLIGTWRGQGAVQLEGAQGEPEGRLIEQEVVAEAIEGGTLAWSMRTWVLDAPPPVPPTAAFAESEEEPTPEPEAPAPAEAEPERRLLVAESGYWRVAGPVPGQDLEAAQRAKPGTPEAVVSYELEVNVTSSQGAVEVYVGEVRGPRIQLATDLVGRTESAPSHIAARRMFGLVGGRLMWVLDRMSETSEMTTWISAELDRA